MKVPFGIKRHLVQLCKIVPVVCLIADGMLIFAAVVFNLEGIDTLPNSFVQVIDSITKNSIYMNSQSVNQTLVKGAPLLVNHQTVIPTNVTHTILYYNKPRWIDGGEFNYYTTYTNSCPHKNCQTTTSHKNIHQHSAIIFCISCPLDFSPPVSPKDRPKDQAWIFYSLESPVHISRLGFRHSSWDNTMNWSMTYRLDSDIFAPYGLLQAREKSRKIDYSKVFHAKTKFAAWFVSNCKAPSLRNEFVDDLKKHGVDIDVFGKCHNEVFDDRSKLSMILDRDFKFYFSFENSFCEDYVTEKLFRNFELNIILVVRGGANYTKMFPKDLFINAADFPTVMDLALYLQKVGSSEELFTQYLQRKDQYKVVYPNPICDICEKLNNIDKHRKSYHSIVPYMFRDACWEPKDIEPRKIIKASELIKFLVTLSLIWPMMAVLYKLFTGVCYKRTYSNLVTSG